MKRKIRVRDKKTGKIIEGEIVLRDKEHFEVQLKNKAKVFRNRKKYTRKIKHKNVHY